MNKVELEDNFDATPDDEIKRPEEKEITETDKLEKIANSVFSQYVDVSETPSQGSLFQKYNIATEEQTNCCVFCGQPVVGHFEDKVFKTGCECEGALKEKKLLEDVASIDKQIEELKAKKDKIKSEIKSNAYKHAIPYLREMNEDTNEKIDEALDAFAFSH